MSWYRNSEHPGLYNKSQSPKGRSPSGSSQVTVEPKVARESWCLEMMVCPFWFCFYLGQLLLHPQTLKLHYWFLSYSAQFLETNLHHLHNLKQQVFEKLTLDGLKDEDGLNKVIIFLDEELGKNATKNNIVKWESFDRLKLSPGQSIKDFINDYEAKYLGPCFIAKLSPNLAGLT